MGLFAVLLGAVCVSVAAGCVIDLVFVVDGSTSITDGDWRDDLFFLGNVSGKLNVSSHGTLVGIVQFASSYEIETYLTGNLPTLQSIIASIRQMHGNTDMGDGLIEAWTVFKTSGRPGTPRVLVLVTDGKANEGPNPVQVAAQLRAAPYNVSIVCVGVGDSVDFAELQQIASPPISETVFPVADWSQLAKFVDGVIAASCSLSCPHGCSGHGRCDNGTCICQPGYGGADCSIPSCPGNPPCSGHGTCNNEGQCTCNSNWSGPDCSIPVCPGNPPCSGHGNCNEGQCTCENGWTGPDCGTSNCPFNCSGHGLCQGGGTCLCNPGWTGPGCNTPSCPGNPPCSDHGTCSNGQCICNSNWSGPDCSIPVCPGNPPCSGHGTCNEGQCTCESGWSGPDCGTGSCPGDPPCSGNGLCQGGQCVCAPGFSPPDCQPMQDPYGKCLAACFNQQKFCDANCAGSPSCIAQCHTAYGGCVTGCAGSSDN